MKQLLDRLVHLHAVWRSMGERPVLFACIGFALVLLVLTRLEVRVVQRSADHLADQVVPLVALVRVPVSWSRSLGEEVGALLAVYAENQRLREENQRLLDWQARAVRLGVENRSLRTMLEMPAPVPSAELVHARIVADSAGPFVHTRLLDIGADTMIVPGMAVMSPAGMVGRVIAVGERSSRILLLTDLNSKVPVVVERSGDQALLAGDNSAEPRLEFLPLGPQVQIGDRVITSGRGGVLPPGLMIGEVSRIEGSRVTVRSAFDWHGIDFVAVLKHESLPAPADGGDGDSLPPELRLSGPTDLLAAGG